MEGHEHVDLTSVDNEVHLVNLLHCDSSCGLVEAKGYTRKNHFSGSSLAAYVLLLFFFNFV